MLAAGHTHGQRVIALLEAAKVAIGAQLQPTFPTESLGLELVIRGAFRAAGGRYQLSGRRGRCT
jgi:hypothetical protein